MVAAEIGKADEDAGVGRVQGFDYAGDFSGLLRCGS
jgi:hypothetical protein